MPTGKDTPFNVTLLAILLCLTLFTQSPQMKGAFFTSPLQNHLLCHFYHANLWHWAANAFCLYVMRPKPSDIAYTIPVAAMATFFTMTPTIGFSAVLYAFIGMNILRWNLPFFDWVMFIFANIVTIFIPGVAFGVHLTAFLLGISANSIHEHIRTYTRG